MDVRRYRTKEGARVVLAKDGRTKITVLMMEPNMAPRAVPMEEGRYMTALDYPLGRAVKRWKQAGKLLGMTKGAKKFLRNA